MMNYDEPYSYLNLSVILSLELCNNFNSNVNERKKNTAFGTKRYPARPAAQKGAKTKTESR